MEMPFGKHKGTPISKVPKPYLQWIWREVKLSGGMKRAIAQELGIDFKPKPQVSRSKMLRFIEPPYTDPWPAWPDGFDVPAQGEACPF